MTATSALVLLFSIVTTFASTSPLLTPRGSLDKATGSTLLRTVYEFPNETWVENLGQRANGKILVTLISAPEVWEIDPLTTPPTAELIYRFPDATSALGIAEYQLDVFAVNVGN